MENKKAFTLVELLGAIVVLAILTLITMPIISNVINDVRIKSLQSSAYGLIEASNLYYAQYGNNSNIRFDIENNQVSSTDTTNLLRYKGSVKEGTVILDRKGNVTVCITDGNNSAYKNYNESKVTTAKGKCEINEGSSIVYLNGDATIDAYDNAKLTEIVNDLQEQINSKPSLNDIYPIGSIYISTTDNSVEDVETRFGGTWEIYAEGKTLVGYKANDNDYTINKEGGNKSILLNSNQIPTLSVNGNTVATTSSAAALESGNHSHSVYLHRKNNSQTNSEKYMVGGVESGNFSTYNETADGSIWLGGSGTHTHNVSIPALTVSASYRNDNQTTVDIRDPYITVYMYKRVS